MNNNDMSQFLKDTTELGIQISEIQAKQFLTYYKMLVERNEFVNLTAITEFDDVCKKHFVDSLSLVKAIDLNQEISLIDIGTGAGFPGLALKIAFPNLKITLLDSLNKRITFLNDVIDALGLTGITTVHGRAEDLAKQVEYREQYDFSVSRAVANLSTLSEYCLPFVKIGGTFISYKSEKASEEMAAAEKAISFLGGKLEAVKEFQLPDSDLSRNLVVIRKFSNTPKKYPRKAGLPSKEPL